MHVLCISSCNAVLDIKRKDKVNHKKGIIIIKANDSLVFFKGYN